MYKKSIILFLILVLSPLSACATQGNVRNTEANMPETIGSAKMLPDGTIALQLRGETNGIISENYFEVHPDDPRYKEILRHIGSIKPGQEKLVSPWPSKAEQ